MIISLIDYHGLMILDFLFFSEKLEKFYKYLAIKRYNYFGFRCVLRLLLLVYTCQIYISQFSYPSSHPIRSDPIVYCSGCIVYNTCYNIQDVYIHHHVHPRVRIRKGRDVWNLSLIQKRKIRRKKLHDISSHLEISLHRDLQRTRLSFVFLLPPPPFFSLLYKERGGEKNGIYRRIDRAIINSPGAGRSSLGILGGSRDKSRIVLYIADSPAGWLFFFFSFSADLLTTPIVTPTPF